MRSMIRNASLAFFSTALLCAGAVGAEEIDLEKAHSTAIQNCVNWNGESTDYCTCVQEKMRADLPDESYSAMLQYAQAYEESRRADLASMQVDTKLSKALEPVDAVVIAAEQACRS